MNRQSAAKRALDNAASRRRSTRPEYNRRDYRRAAKKLVAGKTKCVFCGKPADTAHHTKDIVKGGKLSDGIVPACRSCNSKRGGAA